MRIFDWLFRRPGSRKTYSYSTVVKFIYLFNERTWRCVVPEMIHDKRTPEQLIKIALSHLHHCLPMAKDASAYGHAWPGGSNIRHTVEFLFEGRVYPDGFIGWQVTYSHPNENGDISNGGRFEYGRHHEGALEAFFRHQLEVAELDILAKILTRE